MSAASTAKRPTIVVMHPPRPLRLGAAPPEAGDVGSPGVGGGATPVGDPAGASGMSGPGWAGVCDGVGPGSDGAEERPESGFSGVGGVSGSVI